MRHLLFEAQALLQGVISIFDFMVVEPFIVAGPVTIRLA
jgi:hypothetical protein